MLPTDVQCDDYSFGEEAIQALSTTASKDESGKIHITISNLDPEKDKEVICELRGTKIGNFSKGEIITGDKINSYNDFGKKEEVSIQSFNKVKRRQ